ncbi:MAG: serine hydrolase [Caulobacteraceae bacterium]
MFTALLLADMAERGEVHLDDPVAPLLPPQVSLPERGGQPITLAHLATPRFGPAARCRQLRARRPFEPLRGFHGGEALRLSRALSAGARPGRRARLLQRRLGPPGSRAGAARAGWGSRRL